MSRNEVSLIILMVITGALIAYYGYVTFFGGKN